MARPLRIEYPNACYHIINRGNRRQFIFTEDEHYQLFIDRLGQFAEEYQVVIYCYCCMPNHFHIYGRTKEANLSRFMQAFLTSYTMSMNRKLKTSGHLFQGRFKSHLVEDELYRSKLSRYIHLNPIRIKELSDRPFAERKKRLHDFKWSSFHTYLGIRRRPKWLNTSHVLRGWGTNMKEQMKNYRRYVEEGLLKNIPSPFDDITEQSLMGSDSFIDRIKRQFLLSRDVRPRNKNEQPGLVHLQSSFSFDEIVATVASVCQVKSADIIKRRSVERESRRILLYSLSKYCRSHMSLTDIAENCSISLSGLTRARDRIKRVSKTDKALLRILDSIERKLINKKTQ